MRRTAYAPRANLLASIAFVVLSINTLRSVDFLLLVGLLVYVALSTYLPYPSATRAAAAKRR